MGAAITRATAIWAVPLALLATTACSESSGGNDGQAGSGGASGGSGGGGASAGSGGGLLAGNAGTPDGANVCGDITEDGKCEGTTAVVRCSVVSSTSEQSTKSLVRTSCSANEKCAVVDGVAGCTLPAGVCLEGTTRCEGGKLQQCASGKFADQPCTTECVESPLGAVCRADGLVSWTGKLTYEFLSTDSATAPTGWNDSKVFTGPVLGAVVVSRRDGKILDVARTSDDDGSVTVQVPATPGANDDITVIAVRARAGALDEIEYAVARPTMAAGEFAPSEVPEADSSFWQWSFSLSKNASGATLKIPLKDSKGGFVSPAMRVFDQLRFSFEMSRFLQKKDGKSVVVFLPPEVLWSCGKCFVNQPKKFGTYRFDSQLFIPFDTVDQVFWADPVVQHELGHWVMASYGRLPSEGGLHCLGAKSFPGLAWSEGWATGWSSLARDSSLYWDSQGGTFFWFDIEARKYSTGPWPRAVPGDGVLQKIDENEVASYLWGLAAPPTTPDLGERASSNGAMLAAVASPRLTTAFDGDGAKTRGYVAREFEWTDSNCSDVSWEWETKLPTPIVADWLDALACSGKEGAAIEAVTQPTKNYPWRAADKVCAP